MKRFWDSATVARSAAGHAILLDGKPMHLPGGGVLRVSAEPLARAIAQEWQTAGGGKGGEMSFADTPLTRLAGTAQQRIAPDPGPTIDAIARYAESDLLCYRADAPEALVRHQAREWQPWLDWAALTYDAPLRIGTGVGVRTAAARQRGGTATMSWLGSMWRHWLRLAWRFRRWAAWCWAWRWPKVGWTPTTLTRWDASMSCSRRKRGVRMPKPLYVVVRSRRTSRSPPVSCN